MADKENDDQRGGVDRHPENGAFAEKIPGVALHRIGGEHRGEALVQQIDAGAQNDQRHQRGEERPRFEIADRMPLQAPMTAPVSKRAKHHEPSRQAEHEQTKQRGEIAKRENRADAEVDAAGNQAEGHAERDKAELGEQPHQRHARCRACRNP